jgi:hypothetical protein
MKCHDEDNDSHWSIDKWVAGKIEHHEPREDEETSATPKK